MKVKAHDAVDLWSQGMKNRDPGGPKWGETKEGKDAQAVRKERR